MIKIAKTIGVHGFKGQVKILSFADKPEDILIYDLLDQNGDKVIITKSTKPKGQVLICNLENITTYEQAKDSIGLEFYIDGNSLPQLKEGEFYQYELLNKAVYCEGILIGKIVGVKQYKNIKNSYLEIEIYGKNITHIAEFNDANFPSKDLCISGEKSNVEKSEIKEININPDCLKYLKDL